MPQQPKRRRRARADDSDSGEDDEQERQDEVRRNIESKVAALDEHTGEQFLDELCERWMLHAPPTSFADTVDLYFRNLNGAMQDGLEERDQGSYGIRGIEHTVGEQEMEIVALYHRLRELGMLSREDIHIKIRSVMECIYLSKRVVYMIIQGKLVERNMSGNTTLELDNDLDKQLGSWSLRFRWINGDELSDVQRLLLHLLDAAMEYKYKKHGEYCFEPIVYHGYKTHAYRMARSIEEFVYSQCSKELQLDQWLNLTAGKGNATAVIEYLTKTDDYQFRKLVKDRHVFAFQNGIYFAGEDRFHAYESGPLDDSIVAAKFFEMDFDPYADTPNWFDIPTPYFQSIFEYQEFEEDVIRWVYILIGRLLYNVGDRDGWQCIPFLKGQAGTGKSLTCNVCKDFYDPVDVGIMSNNIEKKFGLSAFCSSFMFIAPEIKQDFQIEQAEFQSMVTGESVSIAVKHQKAFSTRWLPPGILAGNEVPSWTDNAGSLQRRMIVFIFGKQVKNGDTGLNQKIADELGRLLCKCNRAYLEASRQWGRRDVWSVLPQYFHTTRDEFAQSVNSVEAFISSSHVVLGRDLYCPFDDFKAMLQTFEQSHGFKHTKLVKDSFRGPFAKFNLHQATERRDYRGRNLSREYLFGLDLVDHGAITNDLG